MTDPMTRPGDVEAELSAVLDSLSKEAAVARHEGPDRQHYAVGLDVAAHRIRKTLDAARAAHSPAQPVVGEDFDPDPRWKPGEFDDLRAHVHTAARMMFVRLREKARIWDRSWRTGYYPDTENIDRLRRAVEHLIAANDVAHRDDANAAQMAEPWKRAADVANQAFMLADPLRGRSEDAARRLAATPEDQS